ncbi:MAG: hypothetical protein EA365_02380 [Gloeocapsa sp. DLM2.Bin57]|nr:MAG: hypothetical protein EA365_02380 [Gloeocapsa sp. DLM2.Bin57]
MYQSKVFKLILATLTAVSLSELATNHLVTANPQPTQPLVITANPTEFDQNQARRWTDSAKFMAGIAVESDSHLYQLQQTQAWQNHQNFLNNAWNQLETQQLSKVRNWSDSELSNINQGNPVVFYPFSGPDFLYAYSFFPTGREYVLIGLEPIGWIPPFTELSPTENDAKLTQLRDSLQAILQWSFFRTNDMKVDMAQQGVLPYIFMFMARTNNQILDVQYVGIDTNATIQPFTEGMIPGVRIIFLPQGESETKTLYYFSTDLSDGGLSGNPQFLEYIKTLDSPVTYLKAASYLMHYDYFSLIRNAILAQSEYILQDDSGMPVRYVNNGEWDLQFYGTYTGPISLFSNMYQPDLREIYQNNPNIQPLDFGVGYKFGVNESNLMLGTRKE